MCFIKGKCFDRKKEETESNQCDGKYENKGELFPPGLEPGTFRVLSGCDDHYTTETLLGILIICKTSS